MPMSMMPLQLSAVQMQMGGMPVGVPVLHYYPSVIWRQQGQGQQGGQQQGVGGQVGQGREKDERQGQGQVMAPLE